MLKIHLDEDADAHALLNGLRHRGWDVTSSRERGLLRFSDEEQLAWAADQERALFTYNASDFCRCTLNSFGKDATTPALS